MIHLLCCDPAITAYIHCYTVMMQQRPVIERSGHEKAVRHRVPLASSLRPWTSLDAPQHRWIRQVAAPASFIGGTAALYKNVLYNPTTTLTPMSIFYMLLLAVHYAIQPRLSKKYISKTTSTTSVALVEELTKASLAAVLMTATRKLQPAVSKTAAVSFLSSSLLVAGVPAALYALQNVLQYTSHQHLDSVTFNGLSQTKTLSAALWCYLLLGKPQTPLQMVALGVLFGSALLFQRDTSTTTTTTTTTSSSQNSSSTNGSSKTATPTSAAAASANDTKKRFWWGIVPCATATLLSGLAGALSQKGVQSVGAGVGRNAYFYAMEVSLYSALTLSLSRALVAAKQSSKQESFWQGWTRETWYPVVSKAVGGVLTVLVHKYTGAVSKGFALMFGLVLAGVLESMMDPSKPMPWSHVLGTLLVMLSGWMHLTQS